ncbi:hypothetical protein NMY22_g12721 [Coprinellus aureogranulatus]|nr:hypothetical protein NMY22_g12721 [Coprinellus aureogranulatus]
MSSRTNRRDRPAPPKDKISQHIARLKAGAPDEIVKVTDAIEYGECTAEVVRAALDNLSVAPIPEAPCEVVINMEGRIGVTRSLASLRFLNTVAAACAELPHLAEGIAPLIVQSLENVIDWAGVAFTLRTPLSVLVPGDSNLCFVDLCNMFLGLQAMNQSVSDALLSSKSFVHLLAKIWTTPVNNKLNLDPGESFGMLVTTDREDGRGAFIEQLVHHDMMSAFANSTIGRAVQIGQSVVRPNCPDGFGAYMSKALVPLVQSLGLSPTSHLRPHFRRLDYITQLMKTSDRISIALLKKRPLSPEHGKQLMELLSRLATIAFWDDPRTMRNLRDLLKGDFLEMAARTIVNGFANDPNSDGVESAMVALKIIQKYTVYPPLCKVLFESRHRDPGPHMAGMYRIPHVRDVWNAFWPTLTDRMGLWLQLSDTNYANICDNITCKGAGRERTRTSKQCSLCSSRVYCSTECQKVDWETYHRAECLCARAFRMELKEGEGWYSHRSRAFHAKYMERRYQEYGKKIAGNSGGKAGWNLPCDHLLVFECGAEEERTRIIDLKSVPISAYMNGGRMDFPQTYLESRLFSLLERCANGSMPSDMRLVEGIFPHTPHSDIFLLVLLQKTGEELYEALHSIARIGPAESTYRKEGTSYQTGVGKRCLHVYDAELRYKIAQMQRPELKSTSRNTMHFTIPSTTISLLTFATSAASQTMRFDYCNQCTGPLVCNQVMYAQWDGVDCCNAPPTGSECDGGFDEECSMGGAGGQDCTYHHQDADFGSIPVGGEAGYITCFGDPEGSRRQCFKTAVETSQCVCGFDYACNSEVRCDDVA